ITLPVEARKSSSQAGNAGTKPLAVVHGRFGGATATESENAQVHVHFDDDNPIDSHTGAHVKIGGAYKFSWPRGNATDQASLSSILTQGFHGEGWKRPNTYGRTRR